MLKELTNLHILEIEPLYWVLEDALYANNLSKANTIYSLFCAIATYSKPVLKGLQKKQIERLREIAFELHDHETCVKRRLVEFKFPRFPKPLQFQNEKELEVYLSTHINILEEAFQKKLQLVGTQVTTDFEYACDLVVESDDLFFPIELKIGQATHGVVSQIEKYCFYFYRKLRYNRYKPIQGVVIGNGADAFAINEIRKNGHWLFDIHQHQAGISLIKI